ncbi:MAG TPA: hypothetical protein VMF67_04635 [Rhizomicrobium sp.]|nr:hypothetical protein [Rhizomicrobium sp.]
MLTKLRAWLSLADYDFASEHATEQIIKRYTRGNVSLQNGWYMNDEKLKSLSARGDKAADRLRTQIR